MNHTSIELFLADLLLVVHALFTAFVVIGQVLVLIGWRRRWKWIRSLWLRLTHLIAIGVVVIQSWLGITCPLTVWENSLRVRAGTSGYQGGFLQHWLHQILFYQAAPWVFTLCYTLFGILVAVTWLLAPPRRGGRHRIE